MDAYSSSEPAIQKIITRLQAFAEYRNEVCGKSQRQLTDQLLHSVIAVQKRSPIFFVFEQRQDGWFIIVDMDKELPVTSRCVQGRTLYEFSVTFPALKYQNKKRTFEEHLQELEEFEDSWLSLYEGCCRKIRKYERCLNNLRDISSVDVSVLRQLSSDLRLEMSRKTTEMRIARLHFPKKKLRADIDQCRLRLQVVMRELEKRGHGIRLLSAPQKPKQHKP